MGERTDQIEREIQATRANLGENLGELEARIKSSIDWREQVQERPGVMLALAFGGGMMLSALFSGERGNRTRRAYPRSNREITPAAANQQDPTPSEVNKAMDGLTTLKMALLGLAVEKAKDFIQETIPGFRQQLSKLQYEDASDRAEASKPTIRPVGRASAAGGTGG
jgi:Protein of unknown function (DUF3618)